MGLCVRVRGKRQVRGLGWIERVRGLFMRFGARPASGVGRPMGAGRAIGADVI